MWTIGLKTSLQSGEQWPEVCVQTVAFMCVFPPLLSPGISNPSWKLSHQMVLQNGCPRVKPKNLIKLSVGKLNRFARLCNLAWGRGLWVFSLNYFNDILVFSSFLFLHKIYQSFDKGFILFIF